MCAACAMAAAAGATGARSWLAAHHLTWLTPRRMRVLTVGLCTAALGLSTIGLSGSSPSPANQKAPSSGALQLHR